MTAHYDGQRAQACGKRASPLMSVRRSSSCEERSRLYCRQTSRTVIPVRGLREASTVVIVRSGATVCGRGIKAVARATAATLTITMRFSNCRLVVLVRQYKWRKIPIAPVITPFPVPSSTQFQVKARGPRGDGAFCRRRPMKCPVGGFNSSSSKTTDGFTTLCERISPVTSGIEPVTIQSGNSGQLTLLW